MAGDLAVIAKLVFHGTSEDRWKKIRREGVRPSPGPYGKGVYTSPVGHGRTAHSLYAQTGDTDDFLKRFHGEKRAVALKRRSRTGRLLEIDDLAYPGARTHYSGYAGTTGPEVVIPQRVDPKHIRHSQRVKQASGSRPSSSERWVRSEAAAPMTDRYGVVSPRYSSPLESPKVRASIKASQKRLARVRAEDRAKKLALRAVKRAA